MKPEKDDTEFQHPFFLRGQENLLENIKRKVTTVGGAPDTQTQACTHTHTCLLLTAPCWLLQVSSVRQEDVKMSTDEVNKILSDVQLMKGKQETIDSRIATMRQ